MEKALAHCKTALKFASSSLASFLLDYLLFLLFAWGTRSLAWGLVGSNIAARLVSACFNYSLNKYLVFHGGGRVSQDLPQYVLLAAGPLPCFWRRIFWPRPFWSLATTTFCTRRPSGD